MSVATKRTVALAKHDWARQGLFQAPRLRVNDKFDPNPGGLSSTEQFFNVCFCAAFGIAKVDKYLVVEQSLLSFLGYFFAWWSAWVVGSEYAARYNNVDFTHKLFWTVYGSAVLSMLMHTGGGVYGENAPYFCWACAFVMAFVGLTTLRVGFYEPEAKVSTTYHGGFMCANALLWLAAAAAGTSQARCLWWTLAVMVEPVCGGAFLLFAERHLVPITSQYAINKFAIICVLALGAFVAAAVGGVDPSSHPLENRSTVRLACGLGFVLFMDFKFLVVDIDVVATEDHAVTQSSRMRAIWRQFQPFLILSLVMAAAGLASLLGHGPRQFRDASTADASEQFARQLAYGATGSVLALLVLQRAYLHHCPEHVAAHPNLMDDRKLASRIQLTVAALLFLAPWLLPPSDTGRRAGVYVRDIGLLATAATGLVVMHLYLKQKELDHLDEIAALELTVAGTPLEMAHAKDNISRNSQVIDAESHASSNTWEAASNVFAYNPTQKRSGMET